jgi:hypothetical protein
VSDSMVGVVVEAQVDGDREPADAVLQIRKDRYRGLETFTVRTDASYTALRMSQKDALGPRPPLARHPRDGRAPPVRPGVDTIEGIYSP